MGKKTNNMYEALQDYLKNSELRIVNDNFRIRMSPDIANNYDKGIYNNAIAEHTAYIKEILALGLHNTLDKKPIIYTYLVPDDRLKELLMYPYDRSRGGRPVACFDKDGLFSAYGATQNTFIMNGTPSVAIRVNHIHEYVHLIQGQFHPFKHMLFQEGFAEMVPWYLMDYEKKCPAHAMALVNTDIYSADELLKGASFRDVVPNRTCSFQKSYMSSYLFIRAVIENIEKNLNLTKQQAAVEFLKCYGADDTDKYSLIQNLANVAKIDYDKLVHATDYQKEVLQRIQNIVTMNTEMAKIKEVCK